MNISFIFHLSYNTYLTVPTNRTGSWGMMASFDLRSSNPIVVISILSITIEPESASTNLNKPTPRDDFPVM